MSNAKIGVIGVIGGSGLYAIEGLRDEKWVTVETPWGAPSDQILTGRLVHPSIAKHIVQMTIDVSAIPAGTGRNIGYIR